MAIQPLNLFSIFLGLLTISEAICFTLKWYWLTEKKKSAFQVVVVKLMLSAFKISLHGYGLILDKSNSSIGHLFAYLKVFLHIPQVLTCVA